MMDALYLLACGILCNKTESEGACQEVLRALHSSDPGLRCAAELVLARLGQSRSTLAGLELSFENDNACICRQVDGALPERQSFVARSSGT
jgi:hypothetical protein